MELVWNWCGTGVELVWNWCGTGAELVWSWCGTGAGPQTNRFVVENKIITFVLIKGGWLQRLDNPIIG